MRRTRKIGNALMFEPVVTKVSAYRRVVDELEDLKALEAAEGKKDEETGEEMIGDLVTHVIVSSAILAAAIAAYQSGGFPPPEPPSPPHS